MARRFSSTLTRREVVKGAATTGLLAASGIGPRPVAARAARFLVYDSRFPPSRLLAMVGAEVGLELVSTSGDVTAYGRICSRRRGAPSASRS